VSLADTLIPSFTETPMNLSRHSGKNETARDLEVNVEGLGVANASQPLVPPIERYRRQLP
jgi:hypothetical protein